MHLCIPQRTSPQVYLKYRSRYTLLGRQANFALTAKRYSDCCEIVLQFSRDFRRRHLYQDCCEIHTSVLPTKRQRKGQHNEVYNTDTFYDIWYTLRLVLIKIKIRGEASRLPRFYIIKIRFVPKTKKANARITVGNGYTESCARSEFCNARVRDLRVYGRLNLVCRTLFAAIMAPLRVVATGYG